MINTARLPQRYIWRCTYLDVMRRKHRVELTASTLDGVYALLDVICPTRWAESLIRIG